MSNGDCAGSRTERKLAGTTATPSVVVVDRVQVEPTIDPGPNGAGPLGAPQQCEVEILNEHHLDVVRRFGGDAVAGERDVAGGEDRRLGVVDVGALDHRPR